MENELPEDQTQGDARNPLESPADIDRPGMGESSSVSTGSIPEADSVGEDAQEAVAADGMFPAEPNLFAVDPYTAAPLATWSESAPAPGDPTVEGEAWQDHVTPDDPFIPLPYSPSSQGDSIRRSGLAWSAGIAFFGSVAFTLFLGWIADLLLGISPWGIVGGIVLGSVIGFLQFFRITSRIFPSRDDGPEITPLMSHKDDE